MERLTQRFDALQEKLMEIYEKDSRDLGVMTSHWALQREEQALLHCARRKGVLRVGFQPVPPLKVSEQKAKAAIEMHLTLQSLQKSAYSNEDWTLSQTSRESFMTPPRHCFKKQGHTVEVTFDGESANSMLYTMWGRVYYQMDDGSWSVASSGVDYYGIYYNDSEGKPHYYVKFAEDAQKYSKTGTWFVRSNDKTISAPVTSTCTSPTTRDRSRSPRRHTEEVDSTTPPGRRYPPSSPPSVSSLRLRGRGGGEGEYYPFGRSSPSEDRCGSAGSPARPVGRRPPHCPQGTPAEASHRLLWGPRDPTVLVAKGDANTLKCWRNRCRKTHAGSFIAFSTTWQWCGDGNCRQGRHRLQILFSSSQQLDQFLGKVKVPKGVEVHRSTFDGL
ncbi:E2 [Erinaceus europaeus papillomavirus 1]|uniref:Regulatory protein E2 n=1 Tax=Erinaceus europaeus papillomavirus 1 TaxID=445217 RepID=B7TQP0_9PAPI|nr:E2 [Erinaceus europaeus papillomavirus 1]ACK76237.1 E2 [Erinaceus europaeus papillomavirus 1]